LARLRKLASETIDINPSIIQSATSFYPITTLNPPTPQQKWQKPINLTVRCKYSPLSSIFSQTNNKNSDLLRRLDPKHTTDHLNSLISLVPSLTEDLLSSVDQPLTIARCRKTGRDYLLCDYNRDGDSYRSPWSGEFETPLGGSGAGGVDEQGNNEGAGEGAVPSERVRKMEIRANEAFDVYRELYYEGGVSSVYFWNLDDGFAGVVLLKKGMFPPLLSKIRGEKYLIKKQLLRRPEGVREPGTQSTCLRLLIGLEQHITSSPAQSFCTCPPGRRVWERWI
jgi:hypothetical protein